MKKRIQTLKLQITHCILSHEIEAKSMLHHTLLPLFIVWIVLPTCMSCSDDDTIDFQSSEDALKVYQTYLGSLKDMKTSNTAIFCKEANKWRTTSDTVFHYLMRDSLFLKDNNCAERFTAIHDSIRFEFLRLTETWRYSYEDVLKIKEQTSVFHDDKELQGAVNEAQPFFLKLDSIPLLESDKASILRNYRKLLKDT